MPTRSVSASRTGPASGFAILLIHPRCKHGLRLQPRVQCRHPERQRRGARPHPRRTRRARTKPGRAWARRATARRRTAYGHPCRPGGAASAVVPRRRIHSAERGVSLLGKEPEPSDEVRHEGRTAATCHASQGSAGESGESGHDRMPGTQARGHRSPAPTGGQGRRVPSLHPLWGRRATLPGRSDWPPHPRSTHIPLPSLTILPGSPAGRNGRSMSPQGWGEI